ncbi:asparaginase [Nocardioides massiliensis]|uniref:L-asparaginase II n=1 Tax=Nocardioides massiliensis TaxID=1325935 RepID=A0ABT9NN13_9ACTN|nr:asparaginase [Nocardioides massiliensis]MDP9821811.1 L-asparaginase II [Nocardioides massiliensis]
MESSQVLVEVVRSGFVEGRHRGSIVALAADGSVDWSVGDVEGPFLPRSCNKPIQALALLRAGWDPIDERHLALACASHSGEDFHLAGVREVLAGAGLDESALRTPPDWPLDEAVRDDLIRAGGEKAPALMNCSGKHAAMLAVCVQRGWDTATYRDLEHPLQQLVTETFAELTGEPIAHMAVDGCGLPLLATSLRGLARAFRALATATSGPELRVAEAIRSHPAYVSGSTRDELRLLEAVPGGIGKSGAEASQVFALPDGRAWALKIEDGGGRARPVVMAGALDRSGALSEPGVDADAVRQIGRAPLLGGGHEVGELRPLWDR